MRSPSRRARARKLTAKQRREIARKAARARWAKKKGQAPMVVTLPIATINRILDRVSSLPEQASEFILGEALARIRIRDDVETNSPTQTTKPLPKLPENIVSALEKARDDKTLIDGGKHVGHLGHYDFITLRDWCRAMRLGSDAAAVEAAVTAAPE